MLDIRTEGMMMIYYVVIILTIELIHFLSQIFEHLILSENIWLSFLQLEMSLMQILLYCQSSEIIAFTLRILNQWHLIEIYLNDFHFIQKVDPSFSSTLHWSMLLVFILKQFGMYHCLMFFM